MSVEHRRGDSPPIARKDTPQIGVVEILGAPPTRGIISRLAEAIINSREPMSTVPFSEVIPELKRIEDGGGSLRDYIEELEERAKTENHNNGRISSAIEKIRSLARHNNQIIVDGHQVGGKTTAIVVATGTSLVVGAGIFLRLGYAPTKPRPKKEGPKSGEDPSPQS